jgi:chorismate dehydratase
LGAALGLGAGVTLRCGRIKYTNDLPVYGAFDCGAIAYPGSLHADVPSRLNAMLIGGELDLSPISAFTYAEHADSLVLLPDLCIGARDEVVSVVLVSHIPPALLDGVEIFVTPESASGFNLLRVLMERRYGIRPRYVEYDDPLERVREGHAALLIGDRAIDALFACPAERVYDLGRLWHEWTGEQTVFGVWSARRAAYQRDPESVRACMHALTDSYTWSRTHMDYIVGRAQGAFVRPPGFYEDYYAKLNFTFHSAAQSGFAAYCRELVAIGAITALPPIQPEVIGVVTR